MKLFTSIVSFNRLELLKETVSSYQETVNVPHQLMIVDNASDRETREWLMSCGLPVLMLPQNRYPGYATNRAWRLSDPDCDVLHRSDGDIRYLPGWSDRLMERFARGQARGGPGRKLGQVGLMTDLQEGRKVQAVGGNMALRRELFEAGIRYTDEPWDVVPWEDGTMTSAVINAGWGWGRVHEQCLVHLGDPPDFNDPYYRRTYSIRGILPEEFS